MNIDKLYKEFHAECVEECKHTQEQLDIAKYLSESDLMKRVVHAAMTLLVNDTDHERSLKRVLSTLGAVFFSLGVHYGKTEKLEVEELERMFKEKSA